MPQTQPRVSIGLPVYNGEQFLAQAIESTLAQDFDDFEFIISDNASTDRSAEIAAEYAARDHRVKLYHSEVNRGAAWNFNRCVHLADGHYFKWIAHDDELEPTWLSQCVTIMDQRPDVVLCYPRTHEIDIDGNVTTELPSWSAVDASARRRVGKVLLSMTNCIAMFGLIRREQLLQTQLERPYGSADRALLAQLAMMGNIYEIPQFLFRNREHNQRSGGTHHDRRMRAAFLDPTRNVRWSLPRWRLLLGYAQAIASAPVPLPARAAGLSMLPRWAIKQKGNLAYDIVRLLKPVPSAN